MAHRLAPQAQVDLSTIWNYIVTESGNVAAADGVIDAISERFYRRPIKHAGRLAAGEGAKPPGGGAARGGRRASKAQSIGSRLTALTARRARALGDAAQLRFERDRVDAVGLHHRNHEGVGEHFRDGRLAGAPTHPISAVSTDCQ